jgi:hypothetical protein
MLFQGSYNLIFNILREWDPFKIILSIWTPKSHVIVASLDYE